MAKPRSDKGKVRPPTLKQLRVAKLRCCTDPDTGRPFSLNAIALALGITRGAVKERLKRYRRHDKDPH